MDTVSEIRSSFESLSSLKRLADARHRAGYDLGQRMNEFVILNGRFYLDTCGNFSKIIETKGDSHRLTDVMTRQEAYEALGPKGSISSSPASLPNERQTCAVCHASWEVADCHDYEPNSEAAYHSKCLYLKTASETFSEFQSVFKLAGFDHVVFSPVENGYWPEAYKNRYFYTPWYNVETPYGVIQIGWRKRVINIDWSTTGKKLEVFFDREDVTKGEHFIHAWSYAKAVEYLKALKDLLFYSEAGLDRHRKYAEEDRAKRIAAKESKK